VVSPRVQGPDLALRPRNHRRWASVAASAAAALTFVMMPGSQARADPTVAEIEAQIAQVWQESEPLIEQYNGVHEKYKQNLARQAELTTSIAPLEAQLAEAQERVGAIAAQVYRGSDAGSFAALMSGGSPQSFADRLSFLDALSRAQQRELHDVLDLKAQYDVQKAPIDALVVELAAQDQDLAAKKATIEARLNQLQQLRRQAYGTTGQTGSYRPWPCPATYAPTPGYQAAAFACAQAGKPYVWAAAGPNSYDCSGLTLRSWAQVGVYLPHNAAAQRRSMPYVDRANLQVGDLVFYYSDLHHVAIYVGDGKVMQAPMAGDVVRMTDMNRSPIHSFGRPG
jgi:cell wall-associated NlpC family hydrolase